jgi:hypothetical protein
MKLPRANNEGPNDLKKKVKGTKQSCTKGSLKTQQRDSFPEFPNIFEALNVTKKNLDEGTISDCILQDLVNT